MQQVSWAVWQSILPFQSQAWSHLRARFCNRCFFVIIIIFFFRSPSSFCFILFHFCIFFVICFFCEFKSLIWNWQEHPDCLSRSVSFKNNPSSQSFSISSGVFYFCLLLLPLLFLLFIVVCHCSIPSSICFGRCWLFLLLLLVIVFTDKCRFGSFAFFAHIDSTSSCPRFNCHFFLFGIFVFRILLLLLLLIIIIISGCDSDFPVFSFVILLPFFNCPPNFVLYPSWRSSCKLPFFLSFFLSCCSSFFVLFSSPSHHCCFILILIIVILLLLLLPVFLFYQLLFPLLLWCLSCLDHFSCLVRNTQAGKASSAKFVANSVVRTVR